MDEQELNDKRKEKARKLKEYVEGPGRGTPVDQLLSELKRRLLEEALLQEVAHNYAPAAGCRDI